jgi:hypothetical protein
MSHYQNYWPKDEEELFREWIIENPTENVKGTVNHPVLASWFPSYKPSRIYNKWRMLRESLGMKPTIVKYEKWSRNRVPTEPSQCDATGQMIERNLVFWNDLDRVWKLQKISDEKLLEKDREIAQLKIALNKYSQIKELIGG